MKRYENYKDSGIKWLGEIPSTWIVSKLKWELEFLNSKRVPIEAGERHGKKGIYPYYGASGIIDYVEDYIFDGTYILLGEDGANILSRSSPMAFIAEGKFWVNNHAHILNVPYGEISYFCEQIELNDFTPVSTGSAQPKLTKDAVANLIIVVPPLEEQKKIVKYIRYQTEIIDELINKKERLIEKLKEKRQAIINEAVTKGLDHNAKMKDSRIEWLGKVPEDWTVNRVGNVSELMTGFPWKSELFDFEKGIKIVRGENVSEGFFRWGERARFWNPESVHDQKYFLKESDIIVAMDGSKVGKNYVLVQAEDLPLLLHQRMCRLRTNTRVNSEFLAIYIASDMFRYYIDTSKTDPMIPHITQKDISDFKFALPPLNEQNRIVEFLRQVFKQIGDLVEKEAKMIEKLKEYRQSLMSEAVTGKIDVRDWERKN